jgi:PPM family protein phosphatase
MPTNIESVVDTGHLALVAKTFGVTDRGRVRPSNDDQFLRA